MLDLDLAYSEFQRKEAELNAALRECEDEQAAGRIGLEPYERAKLLSEQLTTLSSIIVKQIDAALAAL